MFIGLLWQELPSFACTRRGNTHSYASDSTILRKFQNNTIPSTLLKNVAGSTSKCLQSK